MQHKQNTTTRLLRQTALWATITLTACANINSNTPENQVSQRATERWQALVAKDFNLAYTFNTAGFKAVVTAEIYKARFGSSVAWVGAEVVSVECPETTKCTAKLRIEYKPMLGSRSGGPMNTHIEETWLLEDGKWSIFQPVQSN